MFRSTKRQAEWALFAARHGVTRIKFPLFNKTRWFSRMQCITTLTLNLHVLILYLEEDGHDWPAAKEFLEKMKGMKIITTLFLLRDMSDPIELLSQNFQRDDFMAFDVEARLEKATSKIKSIFGGDAIILKESTHLKDFVSKCSTSGVWNPCPGVKIQLSVRRFKLSSLQSLSKRLANTICSDLNERFSDAGLLTAFRIFDPRGFFGLTDNDLPKYGSNQFTMLIQHFCKSTCIKLFAIESTEKYRLILAEFQNHKKIMFKLVRENKIIIMRAAWCHIKQFHADERIFL